MSDLEISRKKISAIFTENGGRFLIPDYQRPYSWSLDECETLWEDLKNFAFPSDGEFDDDYDEYFLGTIVTFQNRDYKNTEVIDGQQRLVTLLLLMRAFYEAFNDKTNDACKEIAKCIWRINPDYTPDKTHFKITSVVATDEDVAEFNKIISEGAATKGNKSHYAENYRYFQKEIDALRTDQFFIFPKRILENCIVLPITTMTFGTALRIFTTLNDRGMPLSDSDIFKSQFYKLFKSKGKDAKENFVRRWKKLEEFCNKNFHPRTGTPVDDLFMRYMYYLLAKSETKSDTFKGLRPFYEQENYKILQSEETFEDLETLAKFWEDIILRDDRRFSERVLKCLYVLSYSPHSIWTYVVSIYFMGNRDRIDDEKFYNFLQKITAVLLMHSIANPGTHNIRRPFFTEFQNILHGRELIFKDAIQNIKIFIEQLRNTKFSQSKKITRAMLAWWMFQQENQELPPLDTSLEVEHIYAKNRHNFEPLSSEENLELLGNKTLLEKRINIRASDYRFADKKEYYTGYKRNGKKSDATCNVELIRIAQTHSDFTERDILKRNEEFLNAFIAYLHANNLLR